jgi:DNA-binding NarL/FixJ family response regulator
MPRVQAVRQNASMQTNRPTNVYIVDDSPSIRSRLIEMLAAMPDVKLAGQAGSAGDAVDGILLTLPDSVLLDLNLSGRSGIEVLRAVHKREPGIVFVVLTNHAEPQYRRACAMAGAAYFLDKSTEFERVRDVIAEIAATH